MANNPSQQRSPESRALYIRFCDKFKETQGRSYKGKFFPETASLQKLLNEPSITVEFVEKMIDYLFEEKRGYLNGKVASINMLCYNRTKVEIIEAVRNQDIPKQDDGWVSKIRKMKI